MHNFTNLKNGILLLTFLAVTAYNGFAQDQKDSIQYSTDTTTVAVVQKNKGPRHSGKVLDANTNAPMSGVSVSVPGFSATITNDKGEFAVTIPDYQSTLQISNQGYHTKLVPVFKGRSVVVKLYPQTFPSQFGEVYLPEGTKSRSRTVGAVSGVTNEEWSENSETLSSNYQGRLSGVNTIRRSGTAGIGAEVFVRGFTSLYGTNKPLYVLDGMIYDANSYGSSLSIGHENNPLQHIDPRDIASITVIKDAVQSAAYGTRAANGVVLIKTNTAAGLETKIDFASYGGVNSSPKKYPVMNSGDYRIYITDIMRSAGLNPSQIGSYRFMNDVNDSQNTQYYTYHNTQGQLYDTKWQDEVFRSSYDQNYYLKISGGDNVAKYSLSLGYLDDKGVTDSTSYLRYNTRFNADLNLTQHLTGDVHLSFSYGQQSLKDQGLSAVTNPIFLALVKSPFENKNQVGSLGEISPKLGDTDTLGVGNPRALIENAVNTAKNYRFFGAANFAYKFNNTFKLSTLVGITYDKNQEASFVPRLGVADEVINFNLVESRTGSGVMRYNAFNTDTKLTYDKTFDSVHKFNAAVGFRITTNKSEQDFARGYNTGTDQLVTIGNSNAATRVFGGGIGNWRTLNNYITGNYSYADKYLVNASIAVDGSSRFGNKGDGLIIGGNKFAVLPAIGAAWIVSSEDFMRNYKNIDLLKLRMSYGLVGNDDIGNYSARRTYSSQNLLGLQGIVRSNIANPYLQWELVKKFNAGVDASFFDERFSFSLDFWNHKTDKVITEQKVEAVSVGIDSYLANNAAMTTSGIDLGLNTRVLNGVLKWDAGITLGTYKNKVTKLGSNQTIYNDYAGGTYITQVGSDANLFYGYRTNGVYATDAAAAAQGLAIIDKNQTVVPFTAGDVRFVDISGPNGVPDGVIDQNDRTIIGNPNPDLYGSLNNAFSYKKWRLDALFTFVTGNDIYNYNRAQLESGSNVYNQTNALLNRWRAQGQVTNIPKATYGDPMGNSRFSDRWIEDGSYLRLRTLALTYSLPIIGKAFKYLNIYGTANNVFTLSKYKGFDPEFSASGSIFTQGVDTTLEPQFRSFQLGLRLGL